MNEHQRKDHTVKRKRKQDRFEPTMGLTQVGVLHGELPGDMVPMARFRELMKVNEKRYREIYETKQCLAWCDENLVAVEHWNGWHVAFHPNHHIHCNTLYSTLYAAWKERDAK